VVDARDIQAVERAMVRLRRAMSRRTLQQRSASHPPPESAALFAVLDALDERDCLGVTEIAEVIAVDQPRASKLVVRAVNEGLVRRAADRADRRRQSLFLTSKGRQIVESAHRTRRAAIADSMATFSDAEAHQFARLLTNFVERW
jgi:DNA-binding MarR family transcriptional regulator